MNNLRSIATIVILIGISIPLVSLVLSRGYSSDNDLFTNVQEIYLTFKEGDKIPVFKNVLYDNLNLFKYEKYEYDVSNKTLNLIPHANGSLSVERKEVTIIDRDLVVYFPSDLSKQEIQTMLDTSYASTALEDAKENKWIAMAFSNYKQGESWSIPYRYLLVFGIVLIFIGAGLLLLIRK